MSYQDFKKQAGFLSYANQAASVVKNHFSQPETQNQIKDNLNAVGKGALKVTNWATGGVLAPFRDKLVGAAVNAGKKIDNTVRAKDPGLVSANAFKDEKSTQSFLRSLPNTIQTGTNFTQQQQALGDAGLIQGLFDSDKIAPERKAALFKSFKENNPQWVPSLVKAVKGASPEGLKTLQSLMGKDGSGASFFTEEEQKQLTSAAQSASWNAIKSDPLNNLPKVAGLFLRQHGMDGLAGFAESPFAFYGTLLAVLFGGGMLLSGGNSQQQPIIINQGSGSYDPRMAQTPYSY